jgi:hypothetical protein
VELFKLHIEIIGRIEAEIARDACCIAAMPRRTPSESGLKVAPAL